jgi:isopentenyl phosphate kinase
VILLKLGGSVLTRKDEPETVDEVALARAAEALAGHDDLVVVHGGGSFGHHHADRHGITETAGTHDPEAVLAVHRAMTRLNDRVVDALRERELPAVPVHPLSGAWRDRADDPGADGDDPDGGGEDRAPLHVPRGTVETLAGEGFVPVTHGDGVAHRGAGVTVLSGDELLVALARGLDPDRVGVCSTVPGVLRDGAVIERVEEFDAVADALGASAATDVTGGMAGKVRALLALDAPASVFGPGDLPAFLAGETPGTLVD